MQNICKKCGKKITSFDKYCPFCNSLISEQANEEVIVTPGLNEKFKDKKIDVKFNLRSIVNELDYKKDFENNVIELTDEKFQYLQSDVTPGSYKKIQYNINYYIEDMKDFRANGRHHLETAGAEDLQDLIQKFNDVINNCTKYQKFIDDPVLNKKLNYVIKQYNEEVNYVTKYFVLPLYEAERLLAQSRIAKNLINMSTLFLAYFSLSVIPFFQQIFSMLRFVFKDAAYIEISDSLFYCDMYAAFSYVIALGLTEVLFAYYISFTIKNRNFKVDKHKNYEPIKYFVPVLSFVSLYAPILSYGFNALFFGYIGFKIFESFKQKRNSPVWLGLKILTLLLGVFIIINTIFVIKLHISPVNSGF